MKDKISESIINRIGRYSATRDHEMRYINVVRGCGLDQVLKYSNLNAAVGRLYV